MPANTDVTLDIMLFEGGALVHLLGRGTQGQALADKIAQADEAAFAAGEYHFSITLNPIELGMAFEAASDAQSLLAQSLSQKLKDALAAKLQELGVNYDGSEKNEPQADAPAQDEQPAPQPMDDEDTQVGEDTSAPSESEDDESL